MNIEPFIPIDKSHCIRMALLDLFRLEKDSSDKFDRDNLGSDLVSLKNAIGDWLANRPVRVGESGTLYRFLRFAAWKKNLDKSFVLEGTLRNRSICNLPEIITWPQKKLLTLDNGTSQWASAAALLGDTERIYRAPFKLALTYEALASWNSNWQPIKDSTIQQQAEIFDLLMANKTFHGKPKQAEDFCFAYVFDLISLQEANLKWPSLASHESNRFKEIVESLKRAKVGMSVKSKDHRIVQAVAMWGKYFRTEVEFECPECVSKSWPLFWEFLKLY